MNKILNQFLNNISLKKKNMVITIFGAVLPIFILLVIFSFYLYKELLLRQDLLIESTVQNIENDVAGTFEYSERILLSYLADTGFDEMLSKGDFSSSQTSSKSKISDIENKIETDLYYSPAFDTLLLFFENPNINYDSPYIHSLSEISDSLWHQKYNEQPRYLTIIPTLKQGEVSLHFIKSLNRLDIYSPNIVYGKINGHEVMELLSTEVNKSLDSRVYLIDPEDSVIASNEVIYKVQDNNFIKVDDLNYKNPIDVREITFDQIYLKDWKILLVVDQSFLETLVLRQLRILVFAFLIVVFLIFYLTKIVNASINNRLFYLNASMKSVTEGTLKPITHDMGKDEIATTVDHYNTMVNKTYDLVYKDPLTGLDNRNSISRYIHNLFHNKAVESFSVLFLDLDDFRNINDAYGHEVGDQVLKEISKALKSFISKDTCISRFGGDEFIIVSNDCHDSNSLVTFAETIKAIIVKTVVVGELKFNLNVSIGAVKYPDHGVSGSDLIKKADLALNEAKKSGKNTIRIFDASLTDNLEQTIEFQEELVNAFYNHEFYMNYQPYYSSFSKEILGFEALIRWKSPIFGQVNPFKLIQNAEEMGLIIELGDWIIKESCHFIKDVHQATSKEYKISINISMIQLLNHNFEDRVLEIVEDIGVLPRNIILEITETIMINSLQRGTNIVKKLIDKGFGVAIDDFGTGYSSLSYLKHLPVTKLKIDRAFIKGIVNSPFDQKLITAIVSIAHEKGIEVVAEGVETQDQYNILFNEKVDVIQGYYFSRPLDKSKIKELLLP